MDSWEGSYARSRAARARWPISDRSRTGRRSARVLVEWIRSLLEGHERGAVPCHGDRLSSVVRVEHAPLETPASVGQAPHSGWMFAFLTDVRPLLKRRIPDRHCHRYAH